MLPLIAEGFTDDELARRLEISVNTVKTHIKHTLAKLGARNRTQAVTIARGKGLCE